VNGMGAQELLFLTEICPIIKHFFLPKGVYVNEAPNNSERGRRRTRRAIRNVENVLHAVEVNCIISTRQLASQTNISQSVVFRILKEQQLHPFHYRQAQDILPQDLPLRRQCCQLLLYKHAEDPRFLANIIFSDESKFTRSGVFNMHNEYVWAKENPHARKVTHYQQSFKINVWAATLGNRLLGCDIIPENLNGELYQEFLSTRFHEFLEDIPLARRGCPTFE
ncbi:hypothetical protein NQ318_009428, partial [Aromia moschata]